jgi:hypothetical protein
MSWGEEQIMTTNAAKHLKKLKTLDVSHWTTTFWLVKRKATQREAIYSVLRVDIDAKLQRRFRGYLKQQLQSRDFHVDEYAFSTSDTDDVLLTIDADITDFQKVEKAISEGFENERAKVYSDLLNSWAYIIQFESGSERIFAWRKISTMTQPKKVLSRKALFFHNHRLTDIDDDEVFLIDPHFDFFVYEGVTFIANKRAFESSMNFREGMKSHGDELLAEFNTLKIVSDVAPIREYVGDNLHHLRKLASIRKSGYYRQPDYLKRLIEVSTQEGWELKIADGKIVAEPETIELLLKLLNNDRLRSPINHDVFDSAAKKLVRQTGTSS